MGELILEVSQETAQVMEMGGAGHSERGLLIGETGEQVDIHHWSSGLNCGISTSCNRT